MSEPVLLDSRNGIARITLNRAERGNTLDMESAAAFNTAVSTIANDATVRAVLLTGAGRIFCAGGDITSFVSAGENLGQMIDELLGILNGAMLKLATLPVPVVSALNGSVGGGGIGLALCADMVLAGESMKLRGGYSAIGLTPDVGASWFLTRRVGPSRAKQVFFLNRPLLASECLAWGIVDYVYHDEQLMKEADRLVTQLAQSPTRALGRIKKLVDGAYDRSLAEQLGLEQEFMVASGRSDDAREGVRAFVEKRSPKFAGC